MKLLLGIIVFFAASPTFALSCRINAQTDVNATTVSVRILVASSDRKCVVIQNKGSSTVYIKFGSAHSSTEAMQLASGATWEPLVIPVNSVYLKSSAGVVTTTVLEGK